MKIVATKYLKDTLKLKDDIEGYFVMLGERLYNIKQKQMWEGSYNNYSEFLGDMGMSEGHASKLVQVYARFILEYGMSRLQLSRIGIRKLYAILPLCSDKGSVSNALEQIEGLSSQDVERLAKQAQVGKHKHQDESYVICSICKRMKRVYS